MSCKGQTNIVLSEFEEEGARWLIAGWAAMLESLVPPEVVLEEARRDIDGELHGPELDAIANAREGRRREFTTGRICARRALAVLGVSAVALPRRRDGSVGWPEGVVGSITHCIGFRAAAVGDAARFSAVGIDAEPNEPLPEGVLQSIAGPDEQRWINGYPSGRVHWDRLLFSAKETIVKVAGEPIGDWKWIVVRFFPPQNSYVAWLPVGKARLVPGRWTMADRLLATAVVLSAGDCS